MRTRFWLGVVTALGCLVLSSAMPVRAQDLPTVAQSIEPLHGDVYWFTAGEQRSVLFATRDGIVVVDPMGRASATQLKDTLRTRFPGVPVKYVVLTTHEVSRAEGASVFAPAEVVAHREFNDALNAARRREDPERYRYMRDVRSTFDRRRTLTLGSTTVELVHLPGDPVSEATAVVFPSERLAFVVNPLVTFDAPIDGVRPRLSVAARWLRAMAAVDVETVVAADRRTFEGAQVRAVSKALDDLTTRVADAIDTGTRERTIAAGPLLRGSDALPWLSPRTDLIHQAFRGLTVWRADLQGAANYAYGNGAYCGSGNACTVDRSLPRGTAGLLLTRGGVGVAVELNAGPQAWASQTSYAYDEEFVQRQFRVSALARFVVPARFMSAALLGGFARTSANTAGMSVVHNEYAPKGGRHSIAEHASRTSLVVGADVYRRVTSSWAMVVPIRWSFGGDKGPRWTSTSDVQVGVGLSRRLFRRFE